jgi:hypothetical protein
MALKDSLTKTNLGLGGVTPSKFGDIAKQSTLHDQYSINGKPNLSNKPTPSILDLNGATPAKYLDNLPE